MQTTQFDDAEEASFSLNGMVAGFDENTSAYAHMPTKNPYSHFCFALNIEMSAEEVILGLKNYLAELEQGECREVLCIDKEMMHKEYWAKKGLLRRNLLDIRGRMEHDKMIMAILKVQNGATYDDFIERLENSYAEVARLLSEIDQRVMKMPRRVYGQFYQYLMSQHDPEPVVMAYDEWMMKEGDYSFKTLKGKQTWTVAQFLIREKRPLRFLRVPTESEMDEVQMDLVVEHKPWGYELPKDFKMQCARFRRFNSWDGHVLKLDYDHLGKYLFQNFYRMTKEDREAFFDLVVMLGLINKDIQRVVTKIEGEERNSVLLVNDVFSDELFTSNHQLMQLHAMIQHSVGMGDQTMIDLSKGVEWYWLYQAISDAGLFETRSNRENFVTMVGFVRQMAKWFPDILEIDDEERIRRICKSMSVEQGNWMMNGKPVSLVDMEANKRRMTAMKPAKIERIISVTYSRLYSKLVALKQEILKEKAMR